MNAAVPFLAEAKQCGVATRSEWRVNVLEPLAIQPERPFLGLTPGFAARRDEPGSYKKIGQGYAVGFTCRDLSGRNIRVGNIRGTTE